MVRFSWNVVTDCSALSQLAAARQVFAGGLMACSATFASAQEAATPVVPVEVQESTVTVTLTAEPVAAQAPVPVKVADPATTEESDKAEAPVVEVEAENEALKKWREEQAEAAKSLQKVREGAPFKQEKTIKLPASEGSILGFCVLKSGQLVAIAGKNERYGETSIVGAIASAIGGAVKAPVSKVVWLDTEGKVVTSAVLGFTPKAVNASPDGSVFVVGEGQISHYAVDGTLLAKSESPHLTEINAKRQEFETDVMERHAEEVASYKEQVDNFKDALKELEAKPEADRTPREKTSYFQTKSMVAAYEQMLTAKEKQTREQVIDVALTRLKELHRVAVSDKDLFVVTHEATGYGFCVWRMTHDLKEPKKVISKLSGCCGQMDVQIAGEGLAVAENSRHRVVLFDRDGNNTKAFGETSRADVTKGFGGCCNPMNTCLDPKGCLLTSESNGLVKRYTVDGKFEEVLGAAKVTEGCKNSSIGISPEGTQLYYFDVEKGQILVLNRAA